MGILTLAKSILLLSHVPYEQGQTIFWKIGESSHFHPGELRLLCGPLTGIVYYTCQGIGGNVSICWADDGCSEPDFWTHEIVVMPSAPEILPMLIALANMNVLVLLGARENAQNHFSFNRADIVILVSSGAYAIWQIVDPSEICHFWDVYICI